MSPPTRSHIPTSWLLVSYVPTHTITHTPIMDTGVLCPHPHTHTYQHHGYRCLMPPPKKSEIPTSWILVSYVPTHIIMHIHIMDTGVLSPHPHDLAYSHHRYWCLISPPTWSCIPTSWLLMSYVRTHMIMHTLSLIHI